MYNIAVSDQSLQPILTNSQTYYLPHPYLCLTETKYLPELKYPDEDIYYVRTEAEGLSMLLTSLIVDIMSYQCDNYLEEKLLRMESFETSRLGIYEIWGYGIVAKLGFVAERAYTSCVGRRLDKIRTMKEEMLKRVMEDCDRFDELYTMYLMC